MDYRADLYTDAGRVTYRGGDPEELEGMIERFGGYVIGWRIVHVPSQKTYAYGSAYADMLGDRIDRCMMQHQERGLE